MAATPAVVEIPVVAVVKAVGNSKKILLFGLNQREGFLILSLTFSYRKTYFKINIIAKMYIKGLIFSVLPKVRLIPT